MDSSLPADESGRLAALLETGVLDTEPEPEFDAIAWLAAQSCGTPMALVSLVDANRTFYKARFGVDASESPREGSFCGSGILTEGPFVVADAREDPRFAGQPAVTGRPGLRFYAGAPILLDGRHPVGMLCVLDVAPRSLSADQLRALTLLAGQAARLLDARRLTADRERKANLLRAVVEESVDPIYVKDLEGRYAYANPALERLLGRTDASLLGRRVEDVFDEATARAMNEQDRKVIASGRTESFEHAVATATEKRVFVTTKGIFRDAGGRPCGLVGVSHDVTESKRLEERLEWEAKHDPLTGLLNRSAFLDRLGRLLERSRRGTGSLTALLYIDMDGFKSVNDTLGHLSGDATLAQAARRLEKCIRPGDIAGRLGGDEFGVVLHDVVDSGMAAGIAGRICEELSRPVVLSAGEAVCSASIGIAVSGTSSALDLIRDADEALYRAKALGKNRAELYRAAG